jgi:hypothetical protein
MTIDSDMVAQHPQTGARVFIRTVVEHGNSENAYAVLIAAVGWQAALRYIMAEPGGPAALDTYEDLRNEYPDTRVHLRTSDGMAACGAAEMPLVRTTEPAKVTCIWCED